MQTKQEDTLSGTKHDMEMQTVIAVCCDCGVKVPIEFVKCDFSKIFENANELQLLCSECAEKEKQERMKQEQERMANSILRNTRIPDNFTRWDKNLGNRNLARAILNNNQKHLYVYGENSSGKTRAMAYNLYLLAKKNMNVQYFRFGELALKYASSIKSDTENSADFLQNLMSHDVVMIDDVCKRKATPSAAEMFYLLLDIAYSGESKTKLWMTFNRSPEELPAYFEDPEMADAIISRIDRLADTEELVIMNSRN